MKSKLIPVEFSLQNPEHVFQLQEALNILIPSIINSDELNNRTFGTTTQAAIKSFQKNNSLKETGRVDSNLIIEINAQLSDYNRVIGLITDINGACLNDVIIKIYLVENNNEIGTSHTHNDGSYCVYLNYILNNNRSKSGAVKIIIRLYQRDEEKYAQIAFLDSTLKVLRIDISSNKLSYNGLGLFSDIHNSVRYYSPDIYGLELAKYKFDTLTEINNLSKLTGFSEEEIIKNLISNRIIIENENFSNLSPELFFAFLIQNYPINLPKKLFPEIDQSAEGASDLLIAHFENLEEISRIGIILLYDVESSNFNTIVENAKSKHLISSDVHINNENLQTLYNDYIQNKPLLYGDETIISKIKSADLTHAIQLSTLFIENNGDVIAFKKAVRANGLGSVDLLKFELAGVTQNHAATIALIERDASISDLSGYTFNDLKNNIFTGLSSQYTLPEGFDNVDSYASYIALNIQKLYPNESYFTHIEKLHKTGDPSNGLTSNFDSLKNHIITNNIDILTTEVEDIPLAYQDDYKIIQKVFRLSPTPATAGALINENIHTAHQIYLTGKEKIKQKLSLRGIGSEEVEMLFSMATARYASALAAFSNISSNFNQIDPLAISTFTKEKIDKSRGILNQTSSEKLIDELTTNFPNISTLFGSTDYCDCQHCQSVYSPSAYLADVLTFLESKRSELPNKSAEDVLTDPTRRQDIEYIKLNCQNTNTSMPYIDLACEILEENIAPQIPSIAKQTTLTAEELKAMPEHVNKEAYRTLRTASYPMNSSFNLWQEESRTYLAKMSIKRYELMEAFNGSDLDIAAEYFGLTTVEKEIIACTGTTYSNVGNRNSIWTPVTNNKMTITAFLRDTGLNCNEFLELLGVKWLNITLKNTFNNVVTLANIGCSCEDLFIEYTPDIFDKTHRFIRLWRKSGYKMWELDLLLSSQNIFGLTSQDLDAQFLINLKKFDELKKQLNLSFEKMLALYNPINTETRKVNGKDESALYNRLFLNNNLKKIVNSDIQANTVLKGLDIFEVDSTTKNLPKDGSSYFLINDNTNNELNKFIKNVITAAFSISESDYVLLLDNLSESTANKDLKIENLSFIYRNILIAKQLKLSIADFIKLFDLLKNENSALAPATPLSPFQSIEKTYEFITICNEIKNTGLNTDDLNYLTYFQYKTDFSTTPTDYPALAHPNSFYNETIEKLRSALCPYFDKYNTSDSTNDDMIKRLLIRFPLFLNDDNTVNTANITKVEQLITKTLPPNNPLTLTEIQNAVIETYLKPFVKDIAAAKLFFSETPEPSEADKRNFILISLLKYFTVQYLGEQQIFNNQSIVDTAIALIENGSSNAEVEKNKIFIQTYFGSLNQNTDELKATLCSIPTTTDNIIDNYKMVFRFLYNYVVNCQIADIFSIKRNVSDLLLQKLSFKNESNTVANLYSYFTNGDLFAKGTNGTYTNAITFANFKDLYRSLILIHKSCMLVNKFKISEEDLQWLLINQNLLDYLPWKTTQTISVDTITSQTLTGLTFNVSNLLKFKKLLNLKNKYGVKNDISLFNIVNRYIKTQSSEHTPLIEDLAKLIQKEYNELNKISNIFSFGINDSTTTLNLPATYEKIEKCFNYISLAGADAATIIEWVDRAESKEEAVAEKITSVLKSKYSYDQWLIELPPMQKGIREKKCHALSSYLIEKSQRDNATVKWYDTNDLYAYFLIDPEMSACQLTSRIKMAISSVQLFVQRCLLNLEPNVKTDKDPDWKQWKWMKNYRIWEANRKVFLYPENWIEPELRDDKTPFFIELENELNQNDITADYAEEVFGNYLQKLHEVSNLEIAGIYHEIETKNKINTLHVIGRTRSHPHIYYYRKYNGNTNVWSAWEKIDLDIKGELIVPIVYNRKLHIFWLVVNEKAKKDIRAEEPNKAEPIEYMEVQLAWSILKKKGWTPAKQSKRKHFEWGHLPLNSFSIISSFDEQNNELNFFLNVNKYYFTSSTTSYYYQSTIYETAVFKFRDNDIYLIKTSFFTSTNDILYDNITKGVDINLLPEIVSIQEKTMPEINVLANSIHLINEEHSSLHPFYNFLGYQVISINHMGNTKPFLVTTNNNKNPNIIFDLHKNSSNLYKNICTTHLFHPFFYQDCKRVFFVKPSMTNNNRKYIITPYYHPYSNLLNSELSKNGIVGILNREIQVNPHNFTPQSNWLDFESEYQPQTWETIEDGQLKYNLAELAATYQKTTNQNGVAVPLNEIVDFSFGSAFSVYNWELFFHAPLYIACKLSQNQKFEEAMQWFHYIFNPTNATNISTEQNGNDVPQKFWITKPFFEISKNEIKAENIGNILNNIDTYKDQVTAWLNDPFKPHLIARYRPVAYQRTVVMKYIDNLIAWGDQLFKRDTIESINEATMLYVLAYEILGTKPRKHPNLKTYDKSYHDLTTTEYDIINTFDQNISFAFEQNNVKLQIANHNVSNRNEFNQNIINEQKESSALIHNHIQFCKTNLPLHISEEHELPRIDAENFCIPANDILLGYWDLVEDRLYKIRHCMNIKGIVRQLPLFEPPIDPALLVRAAAAGLDFGSVLDDLSVPHPHYRFRVILQKAIEFCSEVKQLGEKLLSAIEKKDAEGLTLLRSVQEINVLNAVKQVRKLQIQEAIESAKGLEKTMLLTEEKKAYYDNLFDTNINSLESTSLGLNTASAVIETTIAGGYTLASVLALIPELNIGGAGAFGSPFLSTVPTGGTKLATSVQNAMSLLSSIARALDKHASLLTTKAQYQRRRDEWSFQSKMAEMEMEQINKQILAAEIRQQITEKELENQDLQIEQAKTSDEYYKSKFSNEQLYNWMISQISNIYFQSYQLAYEMAKKAEKCYRYELGINDNEQFINFGYWDSLKKGLMAGDLLMNDLHRLDAAYINQNEREFELTKHISLAQVFPDKLIDLITKGETFINLPEWLFNMDYPGHYMRRIKSISISIPNVAGPYTNVNCTLSLLKSEIRINSSIKGDKYTKIDNDDNRFIEKSGVTQSIATSHGQNDSGLFELNFNDERYLPFEGAGTISEWKISLPKDSNQFDFASISDMIIHINYTAREGGDLLGTKAKDEKQNIPQDNGLMLFSLKHDFPTEWHSFIQSTDKKMEFEIKDEHLPFFAKLIQPNIISKIEGAFITDSDLKNMTFTVNKVYSNLIDHFKYNCTIDEKNGISAIKDLGNDPETTSCQGKWKLDLASVTEAYDDIILIVSFNTNTTTN